MTEQERHNIREQVLTSPENFLTTGIFTWDEKEDYQIRFEVIKPKKNRPNLEQVEITLSYPFDKDTYEDVCESIVMPRAEFDRIVEAIIEGDSHASFSDGRTNFELHREESGRIRFEFAKDGYQLHAPCVINGLFL